jgi:hypothetical protein
MIQFTGTEESVHTVAPGAGGAQRLVAMPAAVGEDRLVLHVVQGMRQLLLLRLNRDIEHLPTEQTNIVCIALI